MLNKFLKTTLTFCFVILTTFIVSPAQETAPSNLEYQKALELIQQNKFVEALPLLEKLAPTNPNSSDFWANYSFALYARSQTLATPEDRRRTRLASKNAAQKAWDLGSRKSLVLELIETIPDDGGADDKFTENPKVDEALREGEAYFGRGEYEKALAAYERAHKLDPKNYEAIVFAGDTFYARKKFAESEPWFAKAAALEPDRELAFRFWGDALMAQGKVEAARHKFIDALIAEPFSRLSWEKIRNWAEASGNGWNPTGIIPPGGKPSGAVTFDQILLKAEDGTINWQRYDQMREQWRQQLFKKEFPGAKAYRHTLREETAALRIVAETTKSDLKAGKIKKLDENLANLIKISDAGLLEAYVLFPRINGEIAEDYEEYRKNNRDKLRRYIAEFLIGVKSSLSGK